MTLPLLGTHAISTSSYYFTLRPAGDQLVVPIGATHISLPLQYNQGSGRKENKRTICLGLTQVQKESYVTFCIPDSIYRLTLAWISSETSTNLLECRLILTRSSFTGLGPLSCRLATLLRCRLASLLRCRLVTRQPAPFPNSLLASPYHFRSREISSPKPFVWFRAKTDKGIVCLASHLHSVTTIFETI